MKRTYLDSGALIAAARGVGPSARRAIGIMEDPEREVASSAFVRMETVPKAAYHRRLEEVVLYETYFANVKHWPTSFDKLLSRAERVARKYGLAAMDALHVASAEEVEADEIITTESPTRPLYRIKSVKVVWLEELTDPGL